MIEARRLVKQFGAVTALAGLSVEVPEGRVGLLGPNGAGKSTFIKLALGIFSPTSGSVEVLGESVTTAGPTLRQRIGYMPEHDCLPASVTAAEFLTHMAEVSGIPPAYARTRAADILRHVGLDEERYRSIGEYSTGMKQRVKLAQALVHDPVLVMLDEPTAGLDPAGREEMLGLIRRTGKEFGISIVLSSHLMGDVERTCDRVIVLDGGHVTEEGEVAQFTRETQTLYIDVDDHRDELVLSLMRRGIEPSIDGASVVVEEASDEQYDAIRDAIVEVDARLRRMAPRRHTLTEIFQSEGE